MNLIMKNMTTKQKIVVAVILGILVLSVAIRKVMYNNHQAQAHKTAQEQQVAIDSLKNVLDSTAKVNKTMEADLVALSKSIEELNTTIEQDKLTISNLKKKRNEKAAAVSKYSSNDIIEFLTNRYKQDTTSTK